MGGGAFIRVNTVSIYGEAFISYGVHGVEGNFDYFISINHIEQTG